MGFSELIYCAQFDSLRNQGGLPVDTARRANCPHAFLCNGISCKFVPEPIRPDSPDDVAQDAALKLLEQANKQRRQ